MGDNKSSCHRFSQDINFFSLPATISRQNHCSVPRDPLQKTSQKTASLRKTNRRICNRRQSLELIQKLIGFQVVFLKAHNVFNALFCRNPKMGADGSLAETSSHVVAHVLWTWNLFWATHVNFFPSSVACVVVVGQKNPLFLTNEELFV